MTFPFLAIETAAAIDIDLDAVPVAAHVVHVTNAFQVRTMRRGITQSYLQLTSWPGSHSIPTIHVDRERYALVIPKQTDVVLYVRPGRLNYEWISSWDIVPMKNQS